MIRENGGFMWAEAWDGFRPDEGFPSHEPSQRQPRNRPNYRGVRRQWDGWDGLWQWRERRLLTCCRKVGQTRFFALVAGKARHLGRPPPLAACAPLPPLNTSLGQGIK